MKTTIKILIPLMILVLLFFTMCEKSKDSGLPTDGDGNTYDTVVIGTQVWLTENLKTTKYNNGTEVRLITDSAEWSSTTLPAYCWYKNDPAIYKNSFGALYNWYSGRLELLCPVGYHVPTMDEWLVLINTLKDASEDVKQSFKVVPVGYRTWFGSFPDGLIGDWWISSTDGSSYSVGQDFSIAGMPKRTGYSVRCIKDN